MNKNRVRTSAIASQGGVISPLLANIYLHAFDRAFHQDADSPMYFANARLVRYADDFVVMARYMGNRICSWIERKLEDDLNLSINREKTKVVEMSKPGATLDFLGFSMRYDRNLQGRPWQYLNIFPSKKAEKCIQDKLREKTRRGWNQPRRVVIEDVNDMMRGWKNYFDWGYPRKTFRGVNHFMRGRFKCFFRNRSQRSSKPFKDGESLYTGLQRMGLKYL